MSELLKTNNCIICGNKATIWQGHVLARQKMALGNYIVTKVLAGFCPTCHELALKEQEGYKSDENGCYGKYDPEIAGKLTPFVFTFKEI